jgi:hypothetical protein
LGVPIVRMMKWWTVVFKFEVILTDVEGLWMTTGTRMNQVYTTKSINIGKD